jgi:hypothetical protein
MIHLSFSAAGLNCVSINVMFSFLLLLPPPPNKILVHTHTKFVKNKQGRSFFFVSQAPRFKIWFFFSKNSHFFFKFQLIFVDEEDDCKGIAIQPWGNYIINTRQLLLLQTIFLFLIKISRGICVSLELNGVSFH